MVAVNLRPAVALEKESLEELQWRASLKVIVGFAAILPRDDGDSDLDALFVDPEMWQRGIGRALVEHCCAAAKTAGAKSLHVVGNPHAEGFYRSCGFETVGTKETRFGVGLLMKRSV